MIPVLLKIFSLIPRQNDSTSESFQPSRNIMTYWLPIFALTTVNIYCFAGLWSTTLIAGLSLVGIVFHIQYVFAFEIYEAIENIAARTAWLLPDYIWLVMHLPMVLELFNCLTTVTFPNFSLLLLCFGYVWAYNTHYTETKILNFAYKFSVRWY